MEYFEFFNATADLSEGNYFQAKKDRNKILDFQECAFNDSVVL